MEIKINSSKNATSSLHYGFYGSYNGADVQRPHNELNRTRNSLNMVEGINSPSNYKMSKLFFHRLLVSEGRPKVQSLNLIFAFTKQEFDFTKSGDIQRAEDYTSNVVKRVYGPNVHAVIFPQNDNTHNEPHIHISICNSRDTDGRLMNSKTHKYKGETVNNSNFHYIRYIAFKEAQKYNRKYNYKYGRSHSIALNYRGEHTKDFVRNYKADMGFKKGTPQSKALVAYTVAIGKAKNKKEFRRITKQYGVKTHFFRKKGKNGRVSFTVEMPHHKSAYVDVHNFLSASQNIPKSKLPKGFIGNNKYINNFRDMFSADNVKSRMKQNYGRYMGKIRAKINKNHSMVTINLPKMSPYYDVEQKPKSWDNNPYKDYHKALLVTGYHPFHYAASQLHENKNAYINIPKERPFKSVNIHQSQVQPFVNMVADLTSQMRIESHPGIDKGQKEEQEIDKSDMEAMKADNQEQSRQFLLAVQYMATYRFMKCLNKRNRQRVIDDNRRYNEDFDAMNGTAYSEYGKEQAQERAYKARKLKENRAWRSNRGEIDIP